MKVAFPNYTYFGGLFALVLLSVTLHAQTITGRISGTITEATGAVVPGATVKVTNQDTQETRTVMTDPNGFYVVTNLLVGVYNVTVEQAGFKKITKSGHDLVADGRLTVNFVLEAGAITESVEVTAIGETVNSTSGEVARVIDGSQVQDLALNGRNYMQLATLIPGAPLLNDDQLGLMTSLSVSQPINGSRGNANSLSVDGGFNLDSGSNGSQINNVGIDFISEVNIKTSNFSAEYGRNSGASINVVTKRGGNRYNGTLFEYLRNDKLDANQFFNNARTVARPSLRYNNFGWSLGGPIIKDRFHFFAGMEWKYIRRFTAPTLRTLPTRLEREGDFSVRLRGPDAIVGTADDGVLRNPANATTTCVAPTITNGVVTRAAVRTGCFPNNKIPANLITPDGKAIAAVYNAMEKQATSYSDVITANNSLYQEPNPFDFRQEIVRLDYRFNDRHTIYGRYLHDDYSLIDPFGTFINSQLPTIPTRRNRPGYSYQVAHTWLVRPNFINEIKANTSWNEQRVPPVGDVWKRSTYGFQFRQLFAGGGPYEEGIPNVSVAGYASFTGPAQSLLSPTTDIALQDNITWITGAHTIKAGVLGIRNRKDQNGRPPYTGSLEFTNDAANPSRSFNAMADALLGNFRRYTEAAIDPVSFFRFSQIEAFASDNWRLNRKLSVELGLRFQYGWPTWTQQNNIANFVTAFWDSKQVVTVNADGTIDPTKGGNRFNGLVRVGAGVPPEELGRVPNGNSPEVLSVPTGAPRGLYDPQALFGPRFSFAYAPFSDNKMAIRGGFGMFFDRPEGNLIYSSGNLPPFAGSSQLENGNVANLTTARASAPAPFGGIIAIDPNLETPRTMNFSLSVQRELPWGMFFETAYVGSLGRHLLRRPDINQAPFEAQVANQALPAAQRKSVNALRPYLGFSNINMTFSDSNSNYHSLQVYATKRKGNLSFTTSYTWSKALGDNGGGGGNFDDPENAFNRRYNYGPLNYDRRHILAGTYTYRFPFARKHGWFAWNLLGGWEVSGITRIQTGQYFNVTGTTSIGTRRADYIGGEVNVRGADPFRQWFNTAAFDEAPNERRGTSGVGVVQGPGRYFWDLSARKRFRVTERVGLQFQADFFNAFNQVLLGNPNTNVTSIDYGTINSTAPGRNIQLGLRLTF
ncbi:MAG TPA: carboxypeptidase-like regulatory domain-containing protein [Blastocatellia bacterium]|nr:carboxypeptidase-like regulatory domain-containing protein [Blastocatellia bacterium]